MHLARHDEERREHILKTYLKSYYVPLTGCKGVVDQMKNDFSDCKPLVFGYQVRDIEQFRQVVRIAILRYDCFIEFKVCEAYRDVTERFFREFDPDSDPEDREQGLVSSLCRPELLIIYSPAYTIKNKETWHKCLAISESRKFSDRRTVFVIFKPEPELSEVMTFVDIPSLIEKNPENSSAAYQQPQNRPQAPEGTTTAPFRGIEMI